MNDTNNNSVVNGVIRGVVAAGGGATVASSHDELIQLIGALVTAISIAWSIYEKIAARKATPPAPGA